MQFSNVCGYIYNTTVVEIFHLCTFYAQFLSVCIVQKDKRQNNFLHNIPFHQKNEVFQERS